MSLSAAAAASAEKGAEKGKDEKRVKSLRKSENKQRGAFLSDCRTIRGGVLGATKLGLGGAFGFGSACHKGK